MREEERKKSKTEAATATKLHMKHKSYRTVLRMRWVCISQYSNCTPSLTAVCRWKQLWNMNKKKKKIKKFRYITYAMKCAQSFTLWTPDNDNDHDDVQEIGMNKKAKRSLNNKVTENKNTPMKFIKTDFYCDGNICLVKAILIVFHWLMCD